MTIYKIRHKIGAGGFGNVYVLTVDKARNFALKTVNTLRLSKDGEECCREGTLMLKLCHSHLVHCYDAFLCGRYLYLVMELCVCGSLEDYLNDRKSLVPEKRISSWMAQMADVLRYLHALKVIHRDLKPANVFLDEKECIKLGDLGVARELDHTVQERQTAAGTLPYMSPEAFGGLPYNFKTDIWSLGCCIHEAMTLGKTFQGQSWTELHHLITNAKVPDMPSQYHPRLRSLVLSLLDMNAGQRPDALEILHVLFQIQGQRFSSQPCEPHHATATSFDQKAIHRALKTFEASSESDAILPLRVGDDYDNSSSRLALRDSNSNNASHNTPGDEPTNHSEFANSPLQPSRRDIRPPQRSRPLPLPRVKKKRKVLKDRKDSSSRKAKEDAQVHTPEVSGQEEEPNDNKMRNDIRTKRSTSENNPSLHPSLYQSLHPSPHPSLHSTPTSMSIHQNGYSRYDVEASYQDISQPASGDPDNWPEQYIDDLAKDSIRWLRERFKPKQDDININTQHSASEQPKEDEHDDHDNDDDDNDNGDDDNKDHKDNDDDDDNDDEDDNESSGLVTLFTQSQTAVFIHRKSHDPLKITIQSTGA